MPATGSMAQSKASALDQSCYVLGVAGGSGSGKTYFVRSLVKALGAKSCTVLLQDNYYIDQSARFDFDGGSVNFDHPDSLDFALLAQHLGELKTGKFVDVPIYDFKTHSRQSAVLKTGPKKFVIVDGILILSQEKVRQHFNECVFVETGEELRYSRRLKRDVQTRGRTPEGVKSQFLNQVKPMHDQFVEPSKEFANVIISEHRNFEIQLRDFVSHLVNLKL